MIREFKELSKDCVHEEPNEFNSFNSLCDVIHADECMAFTPSDGEVFGERPIWATKVAWYNQ